MTCLIQEYKSHVTPHTVDGLEDHLWIPPLRRYRLHAASVWWDFSCQILLLFYVYDPWGLNQINTYYILNFIPYFAPRESSLREEIEKGYNIDNIVSVLPKLCMWRDPVPLMANHLNHRTDWQLYHKNINTFQIFPILGKL